MKEDGDELRYSVIRHYAAIVETEIEKGCFCAVGTDKDDGKQGYDLLQYTGTDGAYTDQDAGKHMCQGIYWHDILMMIVAIMTTRILMMMMMMITTTTQRRYHVFFQKHQMLTQWQLIKF